MAFTTTLPSGMPSFCNLSSPKNGNSIIPTRSASKRFAYFYKEKLIDEMKN